MIFFQIAAVIMAIVGLYAFITTMINIAYFSVMNKTDKIADPITGPKVSVIIPARNEEFNLGRLLDSLIKQTYKNIEILVINDQSTDNTASVIARYMKKDKRIKGFETEPGLKLTKNGKINALLQVIPHATGEYMLMTDADCAHAKHAIEHTLDMMLMHKLSIISGFPTELCESYWGSISMASMLFANVLVPQAILHRLQIASMTFAIGQFIMVNRKDYLEVGGYEVLGDNVVCDDMSIVKEFVKKKKKYGFVNLSEDVACYMYHERKEAFRGIERSVVGLFPAKFRVILLLIPLVFALLLMAFSPVISVIGLVLLPNEYAFSAMLFLGWFMLYAAWFCGSRNINYRKLISISCPLTLIVLCWLYIHGIYRRLSGKNFIWKGRAI